MRHRLSLVLHGILGYSFRRLNHVRTLFGAPCFIKPHSDVRNSLGKLAHLLSTAVVLGKNPLTVTDFVTALGIIHAVSIQAFTVIRDTISNLTFRLLPVKLLTELPCVNRAVCFIVHKCFLIFYILCGVFFSGIRYNTNRTVVGYRKRQLEPSPGQPAVGSFFIGVNVKYTTAVYKVLCGNDAFRIVLVVFSINAYDFYFIKDYRSAFIFRQKLQSSENRNSVCIVQFSEQNYSAVRFL